MCARFLREMRRDGESGMEKRRRRRNEEIGRKEREKGGCQNGVQEDRDRVRTLFLKLSEDLQSLAVLPLCVKLKRRLRTHGRREYLYGNELNRVADESLFVGIVADVFLRL